MAIALKFIRWSGNFSFSHFPKFLAHTLDKIMILSNETALLKKGGTGIKVPLKKADLGGSKIFDTDKGTFQTSSKTIDQIITNS